jgi:hypothetical protein
MIEFVLVSAFFWVPMILIIWYVGFQTSRAIQLVELVNEVSQMWAEGAPTIDFSTTPYQTLLTSTIAGSMGLAGNGGNAVTGGTSGRLVLVLSEYFFINPTDKGCTSGTCTNANNYVLERRIIVGNKNLIPSGRLVGSIPAGSSPYGFNTTTGTCELDNNNTPESGGTACTFNYSGIQISYSTFTNGVMYTLPTGPNVGATAYVVEAWFQDFTGTVVYERSID